MSDSSETTPALDELNLVKDNLDADKPYSLWGAGIDMMQFKTAQEAFDYLTENFPKGYTAKMII